MDFFPAVTCHTLRLEVEESWHLEGFKMAAVTYWKLSRSIELIYSYCSCPAVCKSWRSTSRRASRQNVFVLPGSSGRRLRQDIYYNNILIPAKACTVGFRGWSRPAVHEIDVAWDVTLAGCPGSQCWIKAQFTICNLLTIGAFFFYV